MPPAYLTTAQVAEQLDVCERTVERVMLDATRRMGVRPGWVRLGRLARWYPDQVSRFFDEVTAWRLKNEAMASASDGATSEATLDGRSAPAGAPARRSRTRSRKPTKPAASTTLTTAQWWKIHSSVKS